MNQSTAEFEAKIRNMLKFYLCLVLLGVASGSFLPYGAMMPHGAGMGGGFYGRPYYGQPMMGHGGYANDMSHYNGNGRHYGGLYSNGLAHESLGDVGAMANGGGHGSVGGQRYADNQQGLGAYHANTHGGDFNSGAGGFKLGNGYQDVASRGNFGGFNDVGHNKGHKTTGFHKSYHNVETGRDTKYEDEDHDLGEQNMGQQYGNNFGNAYGTGFRGSDTNGQYGVNRHHDQMGQRGLNGGSFNGANYGSHGANNFYNGQDMSLRDSHLANNMNNYGQGYSGMGNSFGMGHSYMPQHW